MRQQAMANRKLQSELGQPSIFFGRRTDGTLSAAAEQLGTEHTTVARHIHALEEEPDSRLFHRSNSGYGLTEVGERLLAGADAIESAYASAKALRAQSSLRQRHYRGPSRDNMRRNQRR
jgi:DNA-binding transcriptional LysR family regulator